MKQLTPVIFLLSVLWSGACHQQEMNPDAAAEFPDVPTAVVQAVKAAYPAATNLSFTEIDRGAIWESDFNVQSVDHQAKVNAKGSILEVYALGDVAKATGPQSVTLPAAAKAYIEKAYPAHKIVAIGEGQYNSQKAYRVLLGTEKEEVTLVFDGSGALILEFKAPITTRPETPKTFPILKTDDLPAVARQYLTDNGLVFAKGMAMVDKDNKKTYLVYATKGTTTYELTFDNDGKLLKSSSLTPRPVPITVELKSIRELPAAAITFLTGYTFEKGSVTTSVEGKKTYSVAVNKEGKRYEITFDADGNVLANIAVSTTVEKALTASRELPVAITDYLTRTYPGWTFMKGVLVQTDNKPVSYLVVVKVGELLYYVTFTGEGKFVSTRKG